MVVSRRWTEGVAGDGLKVSPEPGIIAGVGWGPELDAIGGVTLGQGDNSADSGDFRPFPKIRISRTISNEQISNKSQILEQISNNIGTDLVPFPVLAQQILRGRRRQRLEEVVGSPIYRSTDLQIFVVGSSSSITAKSPAVEKDEAAGAAASDDEGG
ncbi:hypothetical protein U1Q18_018207 [Sarracenia purpurea var. burkii]